VFVDSNVLIYASDPDEPDKQPIAVEWLDRLWSERTGRLSAQILNEFYWNVTRKIRRPLARPQARSIVSKYLPWRMDEDKVGFLTDAWPLEDRFQLPWWDALIVAAAQRARCGWLLTEDLQDGQRFGDVLVVDPFRHSPDEILGDGAGRVSEAPPRTRRQARRKRPARAGAT